VLFDILTHVGPETVERFALAWHGSPQPLAETLGQAPEVPPPLQRFYELARRWPSLVVQNRLVDPPEQEEGRLRLLFLVENQGVCSWTTGMGEDDPPVWADHGFPERATFYASDDLLAVSADNSLPGRNDRISVWVAADPQALWALDPLIDESWEHDSREN